MKRPEVIVVLLAALLFGVGLLVQIPGERMRWQGEARFLLRTTSDNWYPHLRERQIDAVSNAMVNPVCLKALADASKVEPSEFKLIDVVPIRGTSIVSVRFAGSDRNVERVASNTFAILEQFYFTNAPQISATNIDFSVSRRKPLWERKWHEWEYGRP